MDVPLSADVLDVALHPAPDTHLLAAGLISGKVQLVDYAALVQRTAQRDAGEAGSDDEAAGSSHAGASDSDSDSGDDEGSSARRSSSGAPRRSKLYAKQWATRPSPKSCRGVAFAHDGAHVWAVSKDGGIAQLDTESGKVVRSWRGHHAAPSRILPISASLLATGDDDGVVALWDPRKPTTSVASSSTAPANPGDVSREAGAVRVYTHHFDWITELLYMTHLEQRREKKKTKEELEKEARRDERKQRKRDKRGWVPKEQPEAESSAQAGRERLVVTSGDGTLSVIDPRAGAAAVEVSEDQEDELLSVASVKGGSKLVVGTQLGMLSLWAPSRGLLDHVDRIPGHPASVDALCALDADTVLTGSSDGLVRVVQVLPHKLLGVVADHGGLPVERITRKERWVVSIGHGPEARFTDVGPLLEPDSDEDEGQSGDESDSDSDEEEEAGPGLVGDLSGDVSARSAPRKASEADNDAAEAEDDADTTDSEPQDDDSSDEEAQERALPPKKRAKMQLLSRTQHKGKADDDDFFDGF